MAIPCKACISPSRSEIDAALCAGESTRGAAGRFGISKSALARHKVHHLGAELRAKDEAGAIARGDSLAQQLAELVASAQKIQRDAEASRDARTALLAIRELVRIAELEAKLAGAIGPRTNNIVVNFEVSEQDAVATAKQLLLLALSPAELADMVREQAEISGRPFGSLSKAPDFPLQLVEGAVLSGEQNAVCQPGVSEGAAPVEQSAPETAPSGPKTLQEKQREMRNRWTQKVE